MSANTRDDTSSPVDTSLHEAKVANQNSQATQAETPDVAENAEAVNRVEECAKAFPGMRATFEEIKQWRQHPGWMEKNDPFLNGQIAAAAERRLGAGGDTTAPAKKSMDEEMMQETPEQTELSMALDDTMRAVYRHLHEALVDETHEGQQLRVGRAYRAILEFNDRNASKFSRGQVAHIRVTRDMIAQMQNTLSERAERLSVTPEHLEASFARMNAWRPENDPMKTMTLAEYIDKKSADAHAKHVAAVNAAPPRPVTPRPLGGIDEDVVVDAPEPPPPLSLRLNPAELCTEIERLARDKDGFVGKEQGLFFALNQMGIGTTGQRVAGQELLLCKTVEEWTDWLRVLHSGGIEVGILRLPKSHGGDLYTPVTKMGADDRELIVTYWGLWHKDADRTVVQDPRANLVCDTLSGVSFTEWPYNMVVAQIKLPRKASVTEERARPGESHEEHDAPVRDRSPSPNARRGKRLQPEPPNAMRSLEGEFQGIDVTDDAEANDPDVQWSETMYAAGSAPMLRDEAGKLLSRAKQVAELGDHKSAYELAAQGHTLRQKADDAELRASQAPSPAGAEPKDFKPEVKYEYPSGEVRTVPGGYYTESEHLAKSMYEQDLLAAVIDATTASDTPPAAAGSSAPTLGQDAFSKYDTPFTRTLSQAESMTVSESLRDEIAHQSSRARNVLAAVQSREASRNASPQESPHGTPDVGAKRGPPLPEGGIHGIHFTLPVDLVTAAKMEENGSSSEA